MYLSSFDTKEIKMLSANGSVATIHAVTGVPGGLAVDKINRYLIYAFSFERKSEMKKHDVIFSKFLHYHDGEHHDNA